MILNVIATLTWACPEGNMILIGSASTHTHPHKDTPSHPHTHTHTHTLSLSLSLSLCLSEWCSRYAHCLTDLTTTNTTFAIKQNFEHKHETIHVCLCVCVILSYMSHVFTCMCTTCEFTFLCVLTKPIGLTNRSLCQHVLCGHIS